MDSKTGEKRETVTIKAKGLRAGDLWVNPATGDMWVLSEPAITAGHKGKGTSRPATISAQGDALLHTGCGGWTFGLDEEIEVLPRPDPDKCDETTIAGCPGLRQPMARFRDELIRATTTHASAASVEEGPASIATVALGVTTTVGVAVASYVGWDDVPSGAIVQDSAGDVAMRVGIDGKWLRVGVRRGVNATSCFESAWNWLEVGEDRSFGITSGDMPVWVLALDVSPNATAAELTALIAKHDLLPNPEY